MRIGVDATSWSNRRGYGRFARELVHAMVALAPDDEFVCFLDAAAVEQFAPAAPNARAVVVRLGESVSRAAASDGSRSPLDLLRMTWAVWREPLDVFFSPTVYTYFPLPPRLRAVVTVLDTIAERYPQLTLPSRRARLFWNAKVRLALRQARLVLTDSAHAAREIAEVLGVAPDRIRVAGAAPARAYRPTERPEDISAAAARAGLPSGARWFMYVGGFSPHKRVDAIARAHGHLARALGPAAPHLVLVGALTGDVFLSHRAAIEAAVAEAGTEALVHWTGWLPDEEIRNLHSGALALVLPSFAEGFGLPAVEAAACGAPVVATTASPLPEVLEGGGIFVAPGDDEALAAALHRVATDEPARRALAARALEQAGRLTWERCAAVALAAVREAAA